MYTVEIEYLTVLKGFNLKSIEGTCGVFWVLVGLY